jgi:VanZ family protein
MVCPGTNEGTFISDSTTGKLISYPIQSWARILLCGFATLYLISSHCPSISTDAVGLVNHSDKVIHIGVYFVMTWLAIGSFGSAWSIAVRRPFAWFGILTALVGVALLDEISQPYFGRNRDLVDWTADVIGIGMAFTMAQLALRNKNL